VVCPDVLLRDDEGGRLRIDQVVVGEQRLFLLEVLWRGGIAPVPRPTDSFGAMMGRRRARELRFRRWLVHRGLGTVADRVVSATAIPTTRVTGPDTLSALRTAGAMLPPEAVRWLRQEDARGGTWAPHSREIAIEVLLGRPLRP
jgi:hypothetical protein